jgi:hypothetical protein
VLPWRSFECPPTLEQKDAYRVRKISESVCTFSARDTDGHIARSLTMSGPDSVEGTCCSASHLRQAAVESRKHRLHLELHDRLPHRTLSEDVPVSKRQGSGKRNLEIRISQPAMLLAIVRHLQVDLRQQGLQEQTWKPQSCKAYYEVHLDGR